MKLISPNMHMIFGMHRTGKTVAGFSLADRLHQQTGKEVYIGLGKDEAPIERYKVPKYMHSWREMLPPVDSIFYTADAHRQYHARKAMTDQNTTLDKYHGTFAHDDVDYLYDTQLNSSIDRNFIIRTWYRWYKKPYELEIEMGRSAIQDEVETARAEMTGKNKKWIYLAGEVYNGLVSDIPLPGYWSEELSKLHRRRMSPMEQVKILRRKRIW